MENNSGDTNVLTYVDGRAGFIRLNRPRALNSLTGGMVRAMTTALTAFAENDAVKCVILSGEGERGLCAGGDVRQIYDARHASETDRTRFWRDEFPMNYLISRYPKPFVAFMDGIVMGGGVGISAHGSHRIVTERTRLAMPETAIGYFPDVGATWLLPKAPGETGTWLGLTGSEIGAADAIYAGLADYHVDSQRLPELTEALTAVCDESDLEAAILRFATEPVRGILPDKRSVMDAAFSRGTIEDIVASLETMNDRFGEETMAVMKTRSPTSLKLTLKLLRLGRDSAGLIECLEREFVAGCHVLRGHDFYEGVRSVLVDKDRCPKWSPASLEAISDIDVDRYLVPTGQPLLFPSHWL